MVHYTFEHDGDRGLLNVTTHNGCCKTITCNKESHQTFRVGGTATNGLIKHSVIVKNINRSENTVVGESTKCPGLIFVGSIYEFKDCRLGLNESAIAIEYYDLDMEGKPPKWIILPRMIEQPEILFINVDCLDGGNNVIKRYRVSPYSGDYKLMEMTRGS